MNEFLLGKSGRRALLAYGWIVVLFIMAPALVLIPVSFGGQHTNLFPKPGDVSLEWYANLVSDPRWRRAFGLSVWVAIVATAAAVILGVQAALGMNRLGARSGKLAKLLFVSPLIIPHLVIGVGFYVTFASYRLLGTTASLIFAHTVLILPFVILPVMARIMTLDASLERAAASCGATSSQTLWRVTLPLLAPAIIGGGAFAFMTSFDEVVVAQFISGPSLETLPRLMWDGITVSGLDKTITAVTTLQVFATALVVAGMRLTIHLRSRRAVLPAPVVKNQEIRPMATIDSRATSTSRGAAISFERMSKRYGNAFAVEDVSIDVRPGEFLTLLGPSGSGKTTLLMLVAGFIGPDSGRLLMGGKDISTIPPYRRDIGVVFQNYALFPHLSVARNVAFPLEVRKYSRAEIGKRVKWALELVHMEDYSERRISQLSGGQQQRVAFARAVVFGPGALLMDEPLAALDRNLRIEMQGEIRGLQRSLGQTILYVTHDQEEALNLSDRVAVMHEGKLSQIASPRDLYMKPANPFVAKFFGEATLFHGLARGDTLHCDNGFQLPIAGSHSGKAVLCVRPEQVDISQSRDGFPAIAGTVKETRYLGSIARTVIHTIYGDVISTKQTTIANRALDPGAPVNLSWDPSAAHVMPD